MVIENEMEKFGTGDRAWFGHVGPGQSDMVGTADILEDVKRLCISRALVFSCNEDIVHGLQGGNVRIQPDIQRT